MPSFAANRQRLGWLILAAAMAASATMLLLAGRKFSFSGDELYYYTHLASKGSATTIHVGGIEYLFSPHNDHFVLLGRLLYEALFAVAGSDYLAFRIAGIVGFLVCVGLLYTLGCRRVNPLVALAPCVLLLFLGYGYETLLWPFNLHTTYSLAFGLGALLALEREDRFGDGLACALLVCSVATVEVGLAWVVGTAVWVLLRSDRWKRVWIFLIPLVVYTTWWLWARKFEQPSGTLLNADLIPVDLGKALAAVIGSLTGANALDPGAPVQQTGITLWTSLLAAAAFAALAFGVWRRKPPPQFWVVAATLVAYWATIALGDRSPDSSRYIFPGAVLVLLLTAYALDRVRIPAGFVVGIFAVVVIAIPFNMRKLSDGRELFVNDAAATRTEDAMLELSRKRVEPGYPPGIDQKVVDHGGGVLVPISAGAYFRGARDHGSLAYPLQQVRDEPRPFRAAADATLIGALKVGLVGVPRPADASSCPVLDEASPQHHLAFPLPAAGVVIGPRSRTVTVALRRFETEGLGIQLGKLEPTAWTPLKIPADRAPDRWEVVVDAPVSVCAL